MSKIFDYLGGAPKDKSDQLNDPLVQQDHAEDPPGQPLSPKSERPGHFGQLWSEVKGALHDEWYSGGDADEAADGEGSGGEIHGDHGSTNIGVIDEFADLKAKASINAQQQKEDSKLLAKTEAEHEKDEGLMTEFKEQLKPHMRFKERDFLTFEPKGFTQNLNSWS